MLRFRRRRLISASLLCTLLAGACSSTSDGSGPSNVTEEAGAWGVIGDSGADEYRANDNRGGEYAATTLNWVEQLVRFRGLNVGPWGTRAEPRRAGYEYNWARSGATSYTVISAGQHTGLAAQIAAGTVDNVIMQIGANDFSTANIYDDIYNGALAGAELQAELDRIYNNITTALQTVKDAGAKIIVWIAIQDRGAAPIYPQSFPDAAKRQLVTNAITTVNDRVRQFASTRGIVALDFVQLGEQLRPQLDVEGNLHVGNEVISTQQTGNEPHHIILADNEHPGTIFEGYLANFVISAMRSKGVDIAPFTSQELLEHAGIAR